MSPTVDQVCQLLAALRLSTLRAMAVDPALLLTGLESYSDEEEEVEPDSECANEAATLDDRTNHAAAATWKALKPEDCQPILSALRDLGMNTDPLLERIQLWIKPDW